MNVFFSRFRKIQLWFTGLKIELPDKNVSPKISVLEFSRNFYSIFPMKICLSSFA